MATLCRRLAEHTGNGGHTLASAFCAVGCAKVLLVEPGDVDARHPWHFYVGPRRPALIHPEGGVHSTLAMLDEDGPSHLIVGGATNREERFRVILAVGAATMTAKIYRGPHHRPYGTPITCTVRANPVP